MGKNADDDVLIVDGVLPGGVGVGRRFREGSEEGEPIAFKPLSDGEAPPPEGTEELMRMERVVGRMYRLRKLAAGEGPAQVASEAYRHNFDAIFGKPKGPQYMN